MDSSLYKFIKYFYYLFKLFVDLLFFKFKYPKAKWINSYKGIGQSYSQYGQDIYILERIGCNGIYVEVGANHPVRLNNSYLLEKNGWIGLSIDPLNKYSEEWAVKRNQPFMNNAIGSIGGVKTFVEFNGDEAWFDMMSGFEEFIRDEDLITFESKKYEVKVVTLDQIISWNTFDLLLIDVEGAEMEVLKGINLQKYKPKYIMLENTAGVGGGSLLREYMYCNGYKLIARLGCADDYFEMIK